MNQKQALAFVERHGIVLQAAHPLCQIWRRRLLVALSAAVGGAIRKEKRSFAR